MNSKELMVKMTMDRWNSLLEKTTSLIDLLTDEQLQKEIAPGRNRGIYLLGHLIAVHDDMMPILGLGDKLYPALYEPFIKQPDKAATKMPSAKELRESWTLHNKMFNEKLKNVSADQWFERHNSVSAEDFAKEPYRNKLNILITRSSHLAYHWGQLALIK